MSVMAGATVANMKPFSEPEPVNDPRPPRTLASGVMSHRRPTLAILRRQRPPGAHLLRLLGRERIQRAPPLRLLDPRERLHLAPSRLVGGQRIGAPPGAMQVLPVARTPS